MADYRDLWYQSPDGLRLYAREYPCAGDDADSGTVLCMHGLSRNSVDFDGLACHLRDAYRVLAVDQRGRGRSAYDPVPDHYTPATYVADMFTLLDELALDEVVLVGTSMGGLMSLLMAAAQPERIRAIVINDIGPEVDPRGIARIQSYVGRDVPVTNWAEAVARARQIAGVAYPDFSEAEWLDLARGIFREEDGRFRLDYDPAIARPMAQDSAGAVPPDLWRVFEAVSTVPMLLIRGELSDILSRDCVAAMQARKPDLGVVEIPRRGHAPTLNEPTAREAIDRFLAAL